MRRQLAWLLIAFLALPGVAAADDPPADESRERAQALMQEGNQLVGEGDYVAAVERFRAAYALYPSPKLLLNMGTTLHMLGRDPEAADVYDRYLRDPGRDPNRVAEVSGMLRRIDAAVARVRVRVRTPGAEVVLDGRALGVAPLDVTARVAPGSHTIVAEKPGMRAGVSKSVLAAGEAVTVEIDPKPPGVVTKTEVVEVQSGYAQRVVGVSIGATGIVGIGLGVGFGVAAMNAEAEAEGHCSKDVETACDPTGVALGDTAFARSIGSSIGFVGGGALIVLGTILFLTAPSGRAGRTRERALRVVPFPPGGVALRGAL